MNKALTENKKPTISQSPFGKKLERAKQEKLGVDFILEDPRYAKAKSLHIANVQYGDDSAKDAVYNALGFYGYERIENIINADNQIDILATSENNIVSMVQELEEISDTLEYGEDSMTVVNENIYPIKPTLEEADEAATDQLWRGEEDAQAAEQEDIIVTPTLKELEAEYYAEKKVESQRRAKYFEDIESRESDDKHQQEGELWDAYSDTSAEEIAGWEVQLDEEAEAAKEEEAKNKQARVNALEKYGEKVADSMELDASKDGDTDLGKKVAKLQAKMNGVFLDTVPPREVSEAEVDLDDTYENPVNLIAARLEIFIQDHLGEYGNTMELRVKALNSEKKAISKYVDINDQGAIIQIASILKVKPEGLRLTIEKFNKKIEKRKKEKLSAKAGAKRKAAQENDAARIAKLQEGFRGPIKPVSLEKPTSERLNPEIDQIDRVTQLMSQYGISGFKDLSGESLDREVMTFYNGLTFDDDIDTEKAYAQIFGVTITQLNESLERVKLAEKEAPVTAVFTESLGDEEINSTGQPDVVGVSDEEAITASSGETANRKENPYAAPEQYGILHSKSNNEPVRDKNETPEEDKLAYILNKLSGRFGDVTKNYELYESTAQDLGITFRELLQLTATLNPMAFFQETGVFNKKTDKVKSFASKIIPKMKFVPTAEEENQQKILSKLNDEEIQGHILNYADTILTTLNGSNGRAKKLLEYYTSMSISDIKDVIITSGITSFDKINTDKSKAAIRIGQSIVYFEFNPRKTRLMIFTKNGACIETTSPDSSIRYMDGFTTSHIIKLVTRYYKKGNQQRKTEEKEGKRLAKIQQKENTIKEAKLAAEKKQEETNKIEQHRADEPNRMPQCEVHGPKKLRNGKYKYKVFIYQTDINGEVSKKFSYPLVLGRRAKKSEGKELKQLALDEYRLTNFGELSYHLLNIEDEDRAKSIRNNFAELLNPVPKKPFMFNGEQFTYEIAAEKNTGWRRLKTLLQQPVTSYENIQVLTGDASTQKAPFKMSRVKKIFGGKKPRQPNEVRAVKKLLQLRAEEGKAMFAKHTKNNKDARIGEAHS